MRKPFILYILFFGQLGFAQSSKPDSPDYIGRLNLGPHGLEISYELPFSKSIIWENNLGIGMGMEGHSSSASYTFYLDRPVPFVKSQLKWLYNRKKRRSKGRSLHNNSGNFVGLQSKYSFGDSDLLDNNRALLVEIHWGMQKNLGERFIFNLHLGLGLMGDFDNLEGVLTPTFGFRFGYRIF